MADGWTSERVVKFIEKFEQGDVWLPAGAEEYAQGFQILIDSGLAFQLGRRFSDEASLLIDEKRCTPPHKIFCIGCQD